MKKVACVVALLLVALVFSNSASAVISHDFDKVRELADDYLSNMPDNGYFISADDLMKRIESGKKDFIIVDVRETVKKFQAGHVPGAIYVNLKDIAKPESLAALPRDKDIVLYCNSGHEESKTMTVLGMLGYRAFALKFGYIAWKKEKPTDIVLGVIDNAARKNYPIER
ncbi:MAG: rhodanese-like domain-containing protein [Acidobacteriota bacterium]